MASPEIDYEARRAANIARNNALLAELELKDAAAGLGIVPVASSSKGKGKGKRPPPGPKGAAKPVQSRKRPREEKEHPPPRATRSSTRVAAKEAEAPSGETPAEKKKRLAENEAKRKRIEDEREAAAEKERASKRARHQDLDLSVILGHDTLDLTRDDGQKLQQDARTEMSSLRSALEIACRKIYPKELPTPDSLAVYDDRETINMALKELKTSFARLKVQSRAKVTANRIYSSAYHPERTKDLVFFGDKIGTLGIWDAMAVRDEPEEDEGNEGGIPYRLQVHWPKQTRSAISCIKFNPIDAHSVLTSSYDCTLRSTSFTSGISTELFHLDSNTLPSSFDINPKGNEIWVADGMGGLTQLDLREGGRYARRQLNAKHKIGCISVNPSRNELLLTASNDRSVKIWDARMISQIPVLIVQEDGSEPPRHGPPLCQAEHDVVSEFLKSDVGKPTIVGEYFHGHSASSAYWDPSGRRIVSTSYDNYLRVWNEGPWLPSKTAPNSPIKPPKKEKKKKPAKTMSSKKAEGELDGEEEEGPETKDSLPLMNPSHKVTHDCQTGQWLTIFKAQWSPNPNVLAHFTVGSMKHSLDVIACTGEVIAQLSDRTKISAVQAVTTTHPSIVERAASGNASGRCVLWAPSAGADDE